MAPPYNMILLLYDIFFDPNVDVCVKKKKKIRVGRIYTSEQIGRRVCILRFNYIGIIMSVNRVVGIGIELQYTHIVRATHNVCLRLPRVSYCCAEHTFFVFLDHARSVHEYTYLFNVFSEVVLFLYVMFFLFLFSLAYR